MRNSVYITSSSPYYNYVYIVLHLYAAVSIAPLFFFPFLFFFSIDVNIVFFFFFFFFFAFPICKTTRRKINCSIHWRRRSNYFFFSCPRRIASPETVQPDRAPEQWRAIGGLSRGRRGESRCSSSGAWRKRGS